MALPIPRSTPPYKYVGGVTDDYAAPEPLTAVWQGPGEVPSQARGACGIRILLASAHAPGDRDRRLLNQRNWASAVTPLPENKPTRRERCAGKRDGQGWRRELGSNGPMISGRVCALRKATQDEQGMSLTRRRRQSREESPGGGPRTGGSSIPSPLPPTHRLLTPLTTGSRDPGRPLLRAHPHP